MTAQTWWDCIVTIWIVLVSAWLILKTRDDWKARDEEWRRRW
jgi:hypothetical protein